MMKARTADDRENAIKLDILEALTRSQTALAKIIESMADISENHHAVSREFKKNIEVLSKYQMALAEKMLGIHIPKPTKGKPGKVLIYAKARISQTGKKDASPT
ncbi:hypothetical protein AB6A23_18785 [Paenibacillus tarimensis]